MQAGEEEESEEARHGHVARPIYRGRRPAISGHVLRFLFPNDKQLQPYGIIAPLDPGSIAGCMDDDDDIFNSNAFGSYCRRGQLARLITSRKGKGYLLREDKSWRGFETARRQIELLVSVQKHGTVDELNPNMVGYSRTEQQRSMPWSNATSSPTAAWVGQ